MSGLVGVTLEFEEGTQVSKNVENIYMAAPDMYKLLKDMAFLADEGDLDLPAGLLRRIKQVLPMSEPVIIQGVFQ